MNVYVNKFSRDSKIIFIKRDLPNSLVQIRKLTEICLSFCGDSDCDKSDLRRTIFEKMILLFINFAIHVELMLKEEDLKVHVDKWRQFAVKDQILNIDADYLENFLKVAIRNLDSESIELVEHLIATILEAWGKKNKYMGFSKMLKLIEDEGVIYSKEKSFLKDWMDKKRNPRHRNFEDYHADGKSVTYSFPHRFDDFEKLINIMKRLATHPLIKKISFVEDKNPR